MQAYIWRLSIMRRLQPKSNKAVHVCKQQQDFIHILQPQPSLIEPSILSPQSLELGRAHKKASSIVNATIDPDKVTSPFDCRYVINSWFSGCFFFYNFSCSGYLRNSLARSGKLKCKPKTHLLPFNCWRPDALRCEKGSSEGNKMS